MSSNKEPMHFETLDPIQVPVTIGTKKYILQEASEAVAVKFNNARLEAARFNDGKLSSVKGAADVEPLLVHGCLFEVMSKENEPLKLGFLAKGFIDGMKASIVRELYKRALEISGLEDKDTIETIDKKIEQLQQQRSQLVAPKTEDTTGPKVQQEVTPVISA